MKRDLTGRFTQNWSAEPKQGVSLSLTKTAWKLLDERSRLQNISKSELIEQFARSLAAADSFSAPLEERLCRLGSSVEVEHQYLRDILMQLPAMIAIVTGPEHRFEMANPTYLQLTGRTEAILGEPMSEVFPELRGQGYLETLDRIYQTGQALIRAEVPIWRDHALTGQREEAFFNCVLTALRNSVGEIEGVVLHGIEVTAQVQARQQVEALLQEVQQKEERQSFLIQLNDLVRALQDPQEILSEAARIVGQYFQVDRSTYARVDATQPVLIIERDFGDRVISIVGRHSLHTFPPEMLTALNKGQPLVIEDVRSDSRIAVAIAENWEAIAIRAALYIPWVRAGRLVGVLMLHQATPRTWSTHEIALMVQVAEQTWLAVERAEAEHALRESEARLRLALQVGHMGTWDWDLQTDAVTWSEGHFTLLGLYPDECQPSYELWLNSIYPDDLSRVQATIQQAIREKRECRYEYRTLWPDQSVHWTEARGQFTYDTAGQPRRMTGVLVDISERKRAEQEREDLLERERAARQIAETTQRQLAAIFETSPVGLAFLDAEQRFVAINPALAEINGLSPSEHVGQRVAEVFADSDANFVALCEQIYATGQPFVSQSLPVYAPGRRDRSPGYYNVYYLPTVDANGQVESLLAYVLDVTERFRLEESQRFLAEASKVLVLSLDYQTTLANIAQLTIPQLADWCTVHMVDETGTTRPLAITHGDPQKIAWAEELQRRYPYDPNNPRGVPQVIRTGRSELYTEISEELLLASARDPEHLKLLQEVGFSSVIIVPLQAQGRILGAISLIAAESGRRYDAVDLALAEELGRRAAFAVDHAQLYAAAQRDRANSEAAREAAEAANRVKDEFLAVLSHELRSPLNPILGWAKLLRTRSFDAATTERALETIDRNAKLQAQLIEDLLDVSRILQGKLSLQVGAVDLTQAIAAALETVRLAAQAKDIQIHTHFAEGVNRVAGDASRLQQVIWNLLTNAVKFTPVQGQVDIYLTQVESEAEIQIRDSGKGISPEFLPYVFDYFRQEDGTITRQFGGLGLGLAIVRHLVEAHGGTIRAVSLGENQGATFIIRLPLSQAIAPTITAPPATALLDGLQGVEVLIVDDQADMRDLVVMVLQQAGATVKTAASADEALTLLEHDLPDVLISDIGMPRVDGYQLIRQLRQRPQQQGGQLPAIALTAYASEGNHQEAIAAGFQQHLAKPIEPADLVAAIASLLNN